MAFYEHWVFNKAGTRLRKWTKGPLLEILKMFKQRLLLKTFNPWCQPQGKCYLMGNQSTNIFCDTYCLQQAALLASSFLFSTIENKGSSRAHLVLIMSNFFNSSGKKTQLQLPKKLTTAFFQLDAAIPACFDRNCCFTTNTKTSCMPSRWEFVFWMRPNLSTSW